MNPAPLLRIASLQPSITLTLAHLGALDSVVACTRYCLAALPQLAEKNPLILADSWSASAQEIFSARPNLVLASVPYRLESLAEILKSGCPVLTLAPHTLADIFHDIRLLAALVHEPEQGAQLVASMQHRMEEVRLRAATIPARPRVYCEEWGKPLIASQPWVQELIEAAGGIFVGLPGQQTTAEAVAAANPDVLLFAWCGAGDRVPLERVLAQRNWLHLRAAQQNRVFCIPDEYLNTPAHTLLEGLDCIASALHPHAFPSHPRLRHRRG
jgi:iron complex transport system substrate-binding protein